MGENIEQLRKSFDAAGNKLFTGRQSVVQKGNELKSLGAKENPNRRIPQSQEPALDGFPAESLSEDVLPE